MKRFLDLMNHPSPMTAKNYRKLSSVYRNSVKEVAETVMQEAALEIYTKLGLTDKIIDRLQNYYGMAIRSNVGDLDTMKTAIFAVLFHVCSSEKSNYHVHCPPGADSCLLNLIGMYTNTKLHKPGKGLPPEAVKHLKPIFSDLSDENLLRKCLHGKTQNLLRKCLHGKTQNLLRKCLHGKTQNLLRKCLHGKTQNLLRKCLHGKTQNLLRKCLHGKTQNLLRKCLHGKTQNRLRKCLHGKTQNQNESFNGLIWMRTPKVHL